MEQTGSYGIDICDRQGYISIKVDASDPKKFYFTRSLYLELVFTDSQDGSEDIATDQTGLAASGAQSISVFDMNGSSLTSVSTVDPGSVCDSVQDTKAHLVGLINFQAEQNDGRTKCQSTQTVPADLPSLNSTAHEEKQHLGKKNVTVKEEIISTEQLTKSVKNICVRCHVSFKTAAALRRHSKSPCSGRTLAVVLSRVDARPSQLMRDEASEVKMFLDEEDDISLVDSIRYSDKITRLKSDQDSDYKASRDDASESDTDIATPKKTSVRKHICDICNEVQDSLHQLKRHKRETHDMEHVFSCNVCQQTFRFRRALINHRHQACHTEVKLREYICKFCGEKFSRLRDLHGHVGSHGFFCEICKEQFQLNGQLQNHLREKHLDDVDSMGNKLVKTCPGCIRVFMSEKRLRSHMTSHEKVKPFVCYKCGRMFSTRRTHDEHMRVHDPSYGPCTFCCELCGKQFASDKALKRHTLHVHAKKQYQCARCPKAFCNSYKLQRHELTHTKVKPHVCVVCQKAFSQYYNMVVHMRTHTKEKPFACNVCGLNFGHRCSLQGHLRSVHKIG